MGADFASRNKFVAVAFGESHHRIKEHHQRFAVTLLRADGSVVGEGAGEVGGGSLSFSFGIVTPSSPEVVHRIPGG